MESSDIKLVKEKKAAMMVFDLIEGRRRRENLTQKAMQGILRIGNGQYSNLKKGRSVLSIDQMVRGCEYLGLQVLVIDGRRIMDCGEMYTLSKKGSFPPVSLCKE